MQDMEYTRPLPEISRPPEEYAPGRRRASAHRLPPDDKAQQAQEQAQREQERQRRKRRRRMARLVAGAAAATVLLTAPAPEPEPEPVPVQKGDFHIGIPSDYAGPPVLQGDTVYLGGDQNREEDGTQGALALWSKAPYVLADGLTVEFEVFFEKQAAPEPVYLTNPQNAVYVGDAFEFNKHLRMYKSEPEDGIGGFGIGVKLNGWFYHADFEATFDVPQGGIYVYFIQSETAGLPYSHTQTIPLVRPGGEGPEDQAIIESPDGFLNSWHTLTIRFEPDGAVQVLLDGELCGEDTLPFEPQEVNVNIWGIVAWYAEENPYPIADHYLIRGLKVNGEPVTYAPPPQS